MVFLEVLLDFFRTVHCKKLRFFALHSVHQDTFFELSKKSFYNIFVFFIIRGDLSDLGGGGGGKIF